MNVENSEALDFKRGESDGRHDGIAGVRAMSSTLLQRHYSTSYQSGYKFGYEKATELRRARDAGAV